MYSDPAALRRFAEFASVSEGLARQLRDKYVTKEMLSPDNIAGLTALMKDAKARLSRQQVAELIQIPAPQDKAQGMGGRFRIFSPKSRGDRLRTGDVLQELADARLGAPELVPEQHVMDDDRYESRRYPGSGRLVLSRHTAWQRNSNSRCGWPTAGLHVVRLTSAFRANPEASSTRGPRSLPSRIAKCIAYEDLNLNVG